jgi:Rrf2 family protein
MQFTRAASYAIHALVHMAGHKGDQPLASHLIAREQGLPEKFLLKSLKLLVSRGVLKSIKGPNGGYQLAKAPKDITLLEIIEAVDGPIQTQGDFEGSKGNRVGKKLQAAWDRANEEIRRQFGKVRLSDLAGKV